MLETVYDGAFHHRHAGGSRIGGEINHPVIHGRGDLTADRGAGTNIDGDFANHAVGELETGHAIDQFHGNPPVVAVDIIIKNVV